MRELLKTKTAVEKAHLKGQEIARVVSRRKEKRGNLDIQIVDIEPIEDGVQVFARVWTTDAPIEIYEDVVTDEITTSDTFGTIKKRLVRTIPAHTQLGFGTDGTVDIERFIIHNPPILVPDPNGDIEQITEANEELGVERTVRRLREDPKEALLQSLEHTISVMKNVHSGERIEKGKRGNTTSTFYPEASPGTTTFDGYAMYNSTAISWASIIAQTSGGTIDDASTELLPFYVRSGGGTNWNRFARSMVLFDTSTIPDTDIISSATLSISAILKRDDASVGYDLSIYEATPASNTAIASGDLDNFGTTNLATTKSYADLTATGYNDWVLNASGIATISKTGVSKFGWRSPTYDVGGTDPGSATLNQLSDFRGYSADQTGTSNDPKLVVEHSAPTATFIPRIIMY